MLIDLIIVILFELMGYLGIINVTIIPRPSSIIFKSDIFDILTSFSSTLIFIFVIFIISIIIDMLIAIFIYWLESKYIENLLYRINTIPRIIIMIVGIAILGVGYKTIGIMSIISSMPNFVITVLGYLKSESNKIFIEAARDCGAKDLEILIRILIPNNLRGIIISIKILFSNITNSCIIGEYLIGTSGIGSTLQYNLFMYNMKNVFMIAIVITIFSILVNKFFDLILKSKKLWFNL